MQLASLIPENTITLYKPNVYNLEPSNSRQEHQMAIKELDCEVAAKTSAQQKINCNEARTRQKKIF